MLEKGAHVYIVQHSGNKAQQSSYSIRTLEYIRIAATAAAVAASANVVKLENITHYNAMAWKAKAA